MSQQKKRQPSELLTTAEPTPQLLPVAANSTEANGQHSTQSAKTANSPTSTTKPAPTLSSRTNSENENAIIAAGVLKSTLPTLLEAGLIKTAKHQGSGRILLVFEPELWTEDFRLK